MSNKLPLHEAYPLQRIRVINAEGRPSTLCLDWLLYTKLLSLTPGRKPRVLTGIVREEYTRLLPVAASNKLSAEVRTAVLSRLLAARECSPRE